MKFIVIYGPNNIGKSTQVNLLSDRLQKEGQRIVKLKYPIYELNPTGQLINQMLRNYSSLSEEDQTKYQDIIERQRLYVQNRYDYQEKLLETLESSHVIAEDYIGTGIAWGMAMGAQFEDLFEMNKGLKEPDIAISLDGEKFVDSVEEGHLTEGDSEAWERSRRIHLDLAEKFGWELFNVDREIQPIHKDIYKYISKILY